MVAQNRDRKGAGLLDLSLKSFCRSDKRGKPVLPESESHRIAQGEANYFKDETPGKIQLIGLKLPVV